jgi:uncharacterized membrane protein
MKKFSLWDMVAILIALIPMAYLEYVYDSLPAIVAMHYGVNGKVNRYGPKHDLLTLEAIVAAVSILLYLLMKFLPSIDPKRQVKYGERSFQKLGMIIVIFLAGLNIYMTLAAVDKAIRTDRIIMALAGLLFIFLGNVMYSIKPNYFAGIRTPWALEDERNWRATHRLAGKVWVAGGILITVERLVLPSVLGSYIFIAGIAVMTLIPAIYSYIYFKKHQPPTP